MPPEPEHPMEPALRAYAARRRGDAAAPALHPANRRELQDEVARLRPARGDAPRPWLTLAWPRLAFAAAACAVLTLLLLNLRPPPHPSAADKPVALLQPREPAPPPEARATPTPPPAVPAPMPAAPATPAAPMMTAPMVAAPSPAAAPAMAPPVAAAAPVTPLPAHAAPTAPVVAADAPPVAIAPLLLAKGAPGPAPRMAAPRPPEHRRYQRADSPAGATTLLQLFDLEQTGTQVRLMDADGSIYLGSVSPTNAQAFVVAGVHKTTGRAVTVEGSFLAEAPTNDGGTPAAPAAPAARSARSAPRVAASPGASAGRALQLRIRPEGGDEIRGLARPVAR